MKIFVPSKGRANANLAKTIANLRSEEVEFFAVVEPQDEVAYAQEFPGIKLWLLPESNQGIAYVRNFILKTARDLMLDSFWMLDDDISLMYRQESGRNVRSPFHLVLQEAEAIFKHAPEVAQGALEYQQFSWSAKKDRVLNSYCDVAVWIDVNRTKHVNYRKFVNLKEDRDFTIQILASGFNTCRASRLGFAAPKNGSNQGGLHEEYATRSKEAEAVDRMVNLWPGVVTRQTKTDGRIDCKINWRVFYKDV